MDKFEIQKQAADKTLGGLRKTLEVLCNNAPEGETKEALAEGVEDIRGIQVELQAATDDAGIETALDNGREIARSRYKAFKARLDAAKKRKAAKADWLGNLLFNTWDMIDKVLKGVGGLAGVFK